MAKTTNIQMNFTELVQTIQQTHDYLNEKALSAVNQSLTTRNWLIGFYIVEYEQKGNDRAKYGKQLIAKLSKSLQARGIKNTSATNLRLYRQFYQIYPQIYQTVSDELLKSLSDKRYAGNTPLLPTKSKKSFGVSAQLLMTRLSFSHIVELIQEVEPLKRAFYEIQTIKGNWSVRELQRQRGSLLYERTGLSKNKEKLIQLANNKAVQLTPQDIIRDPYIFEFMGLKEQEVLQESELEEKLLDHLQQFLLELGKGFCFEHRQKRILIDDEYYRIDLVFYHRILKCHVLIDLKTGKFNHADAGQMTVYLNYYKEHEIVKGDNPPIGIILCANKGQSLAKYATTTDNQMFVSKYKLELPSEKELTKFIEEDQKKLE
jgi:predicted nuclease of restriction endonuclease-like (RecB) superfamily